MDLIYVTYEFKDILVAYAFIKITIFLTLITAIFANKNRYYNYLQDNNLNKSF